MMENLQADIARIIREVKDPDFAAKLIVQLVPRAIGKRGGRPPKRGVEQGELSIEKGVSNRLQTPSQPVANPFVTGCEPLSYAGSSSGSDLISDPDLRSDPDPSQPILEISELDEPTTQEVAPAGFVEFWGLYPKRVGKTAALRAWRKRRPPLDRVKAALAWQVQSEQWRKGFIPNPATWLNEGRWEDEPRTPTGPSKSQPRLSYCDWHADVLNAGTPSYRHDSSCPECRHVKARRNPREDSEPTLFGEVPS